MASPAPFAWLLVCSTNGVPIMSFRHNVPLDSPSVSLSTQGLISSLYTAASEAGMVLRGMTTMPVSKVDGNETGRHSSCINSRDATADDADSDRVKFRHALAWKRFDAIASTSGATATTAGARGHAANQHDGCIMAFLTDAMQHTQPSRATSHSAQSNLVELERCLSFLHSLFVAWLGPALWASLCRNPNQRQVRLSLAPLAPVIDSVLSFRPLLTCGGWSEPHSLVFSDGKQRLLKSFVNGLCVGARATHAFLLAGAVCTVASTDNGIGAIDQGALNVLYHTACLVDTPKAASAAAQTQTAVRQCVLHLPIAQAVVPFHVAAVPLGLRIESSNGERSAALLADIAVGVVDSPWRLLLLRPCQVRPVPRQENNGGAGMEHGAVGAASPVADAPMKSQLYGNQWHVSQLLDDLARCLQTFACRCSKDAHAAGAQATANSDGGRTDENAVGTTAGLVGTVSAADAEGSSAPSSASKPGEEERQEQTVVSEKHSIAPVKLRARHSLLPTLLACMAQAENRAKAVHKSRDLSAYWPMVPQGDLQAEEPSGRQDGPSRADRTTIVTSFAAAYSGGFAQVIDALEHSTSSALQPTGMNSSSVSVSSDGAKSVGSGRRVRPVDTVLEPSELIQWALSMAGGSSRAGMYGSAQALPVHSVASQPTTRQRIVLCKVTVTGAATSKADAHAASLKARVYVLGRAELPSLRILFGCHGGGPSCCTFPGAGILYSGSPARHSRTGDAEEKKASALCSCLVGTTVLPYLGLDTGCVRALVGSLLASAQDSARAALQLPEAVSQHAEAPVCIQGPCISVPSSLETAQGGQDGSGGQGETGAHRLNPAQWSRDAQEYLQGRRVFNVASRVTGLQPTGTSSGSGGVSVTVDVTATMDLQLLRSILDEIAGMARKMPQMLPAPAGESQEGGAASLEWKALESEAVLGSSTSSASHGLTGAAGIGTGTRTGRHKGAPASPSPPHTRAKAPARGSSSKEKHREQMVGELSPTLSPGVVAATRLQHSTLRSRGGGGSSSTGLTPQQQGAFQRIREQQAALVAAARTDAVVDATVPAPSAAAPLNPPVHVVVPTRAPQRAKQAQAPPASASSAPLTSPAAIQKLQSLALSGSPSTQRALLSAFKKERVAKAEVRSEIEQVRARLRAQKAALQLEIEKAKLSQAQKALHASKGATPHPTRIASSTTAASSGGAQNRAAPPTLPSPTRAETILVIRREPSLYSMPPKEARADEVTLASPTRPKPAPAGKQPQPQAAEERGGREDRDRAEAPGPERKSFVLDVDTPAMVV